MINYYCPDILVGYRFYPNILEMKQDYPEMFYDDVNIKTVFGNFPNLTWNGGSLFSGPFLSEIPEMKSYLDIYKELGITLQFTMTNSLLEERDMYDRYGNFVLRLLYEDYRDMTEILVASPVLEEYIRINFPEFKISRSIVNTPVDYNYKEALKIYENIVIPIRHTDDFEFLSQFTPEEKKRVELLCSDPCPKDCGRIYEHYKEYAKGNLFLGSRNYDIKPSLLCTNPRCHTAQYFDSENGVLISYNKIKKEYEPRGFSEFKIAGRGTLPNLACNVVQYMVKPQYQMAVVKDLIIRS